MKLNISAVAGVMGALLFFLGIALLFPMFVGFYYLEPTAWSFGVTALIGLAGGGATWYRFRPQKELQVREGFMIVSLAWFVLSLLGAVPYVLVDIISFSDAFFETMSGFTTTGATILGSDVTPPIDSLPNSFLFWRSLTHWLGGMGIIVLTLAVLPMLGVGGMQLYKAEVPGPSADKMTPRVKETAKRLWLIYIGITIVEVFALLPEMSLFDSINHAFATMATGGFSTANGSVGEYDSAYIDWVITFFMFLAGINFAIYYQVLRGKTDPLFKSSEFRLYAGLTVFASVVIALAIYNPTRAYLPLHDGGLSDSFAGHDSFLEALRYATFQVVALITTTGFGTSDYEIWPPLATGFVFLLFFTGGMAGSTAGGVKMIRHLLMVKNSFREIKQLIHPRAVIPLRLDGRVVSADIMKNVLSFIILYFGLIFLGTIAMTLLGLDLLTALSATFSSVGNVGPAFGALGPTESYGTLPVIGKWVLSILMMAGRLEIFTVMVIFVPAFWRR